MGIRLIWSDPNVGEDGHRVYRSTSPMDPLNLPSPIANLGANITTYDDGDIIGGETYYYRVAAISGANEAVSDEISILALAEAFDPTDLFDGSEVGVVYDPSDLATLFQDVAGTVPVTTDGDPVALMLDKSPNGLDASQSTASYRPTYRTNGTQHWLEGSGTHTLTISGSASVLNFMHDGTGSIAAFSASFGASSDPNALYPVFGNNADTSSKTGVSARYDDRSAVSSNNSFTYQVSRGISTENTISSSVPNDTVPAQAATVFTISYKQQSGNDLTIIKDGSVVSVAEQENAPTAANATHDMELFSSGARGFIMTGNLYGLVFLSRDLTEQEANNLSSYLAGRAGISS